MKKKTSPVTLIYSTQAEVTVDLLTGAVLSAVIRMPNGTASKYIGAVLESATPQHRIERIKQTIDSLHKAQYPALHWTIKA